MNVLIVYLIKGKVERYHQKLVKKVGPKFGENYMIEEALPSHITLKYPFETKSIKDLENFLKLFVKNHKSTKIKIRGFGNFNKFVTFLKTKLSKQALEIQKDLVNELKKQGVKPHKFDLDFKPHATISYGNTKDSFNKIWKYLKTLDTPSFDVELNNLAILKQQREKWKIHKEFKLR